MRRKILAVVTAACLVMSMVPAVAFAGDAELQADTLWGDSCPADGVSALKAVPEAIASHTDSADNPQAAIVKQTGKADVYFHSLDNAIEYANRISCCKCGPATVEVAQAGFGIISKKHDGSNSGFSAITGNVVLDLNDNSVVIPSTADLDVKGGTLTVKGEDAEESTLYVGSTIDVRAGGKLVASECVTVSDNLSEVINQNEGGIPLIAAWNNSSVSVEKSVNLELSTDKATGIAAKDTAVVLFAGYIIGNPDELETAIGTTGISLEGKAYAEVSGEIGVSDASAIKASAFSKVFVKKSAYILSTDGAALEASGFVKATVAGELESSGANAIILKDSADAVLTDTGRVLGDYTNDNILYMAGAAIGCQEGSLNKSLFSVLLSGKSTLTSMPGSVILSLAGGAVTFDMGSRAVFTNQGIVAACVHSYASVPGTEAGPQILCPNAEEPQTEDMIKEIRTGIQYIAESLDQKNETLVPWTTGSPQAGESEQITPYPAIYIPANAGLCVVNIGNPCVAKVLNKFLVSKFKKGLKEELAAPGIDSINAYVFSDNYEAIRSEAKLARVKVYEGCITGYTPVNVKAGLLMLRPNNLKKEVVVYNKTTGKYIIKKYLSSVKAFKAGTASKNKSIDTFYFDVDK